MNLASIIIGAAALAGLVGLAVLGTRALTRYCQRIAGGMRWP